MHALLQQPAPDFSLQDQNEQTRTLADYHGRFILLYFYPKDMTPGCTVEAEGFRDTLNELDASNVQVLGVSGDTCGSHKRFAQRHHLNFPLLADTEHTVVQQYDVLQEKQMFGKTFMGIMRESFLIDPNGVVVRHYEKVDPKKHPQQVLRDVQELQAS